MFIQFQLKRLSNKQLISFNIDGNNNEEKPKANNLWQFECVSLTVDREFEFIFRDFICPNE